MYEMLPVRFDGTALLLFLKRTTHSTEMSVSATKQLDGNPELDEKVVVKSSPNGSILKVCAPNVLTSLRERASASRRSIASNMAVVRAPPLPIQDRFRSVSAKQNSLPNRSIDRATFRWNAGGAPASGTDQSSASFATRPQCVKLEYSIAPTTLRSGSRLAP